MFEITALAAMQVKAWIKASAWCQACLTENLYFAFRGQVGDKKQRINWK